jgi:LmbE family N-acetylglucosaminyl deacetylase
MTDRLSAMITEIRPDTVLTFGPDGTTGHPDHQAVSAWTSAAFRQAAPAGAQLLHSATSDRWAARWVEVNERLGVFQESYPVVVGTDQLTVDLVL